MSKQNVHGKNAGGSLSCRWRESPGGVSVGALKIVLVLALVSLLPRPSPAIVRFVSQAGSHTAPFDSWPTAATNMAAAVAAAGNGDEVLVSNGVWELRGAIVVTNTVVIHSVEGAAATTVASLYPEMTNRCFELAATGVVIDGFTIVNGRAEGSDPDFRGGGVYAQTNCFILNCVISGNYGVYGGGVYLGVGSRLTNCLVSANVAAMEGGGIFCESDSVVDSAKIEGNLALSEGGGIRVTTNTLCMGSVISSNRTDINGGGVYGRDGGIVTNCIIAGNGAAMEGGGAICSTTGTLFTACRFEGNFASNAGGGVKSGTLHGCLLRQNEGFSGGGCAYSVAHGCLVVSNRAKYGGGMSSAEAYSCLIVYNWADTGGGAANNYDSWGCTIAANTATNKAGGTMFGVFHNSIVWSNVAPRNEDDANTVFYNCCTTEPNDSGANNLTENPCFADIAAGDFRVVEGSPCIDAGSNETWMSVTTDLEGKPRLLNGNTDIGAYEFIPRAWDADEDEMPDYWEWEYSGSMTALVAHADADVDGMDNVDEWWCGTAPCDEASYLGLTFGAPGDLSGLVVRWRSVDGKLYRVCRTTDLFYDGWSLVVSNLPASAPMNVYTDMTASGDGPWHYRVELE